MKKNYRAKEQDMLIIALIICEHFQDHKQQLIQTQTNWVSNSNTHEQHP